MTEDAKDILLKRVQVTVAILAGVATLVVGIYNVKKNVFAGNGSLTAIVRSSRGPVAKAHADLYNSQNALVSATETDSDGRFIAKDIEAGTYVLKITANNFEPQVSTVYVKEKRSTDLEIVLKGRVGSPIQSAIEEAGASWIKKLGTAKPESPAEAK